MMRKTRCSGEKKERKIGEGERKSQRRKQNVFINIVMMNDKRSFVKKTHAGGFYVFLFKKNETKKSGSFLCLNIFTHTLCPSSTWYTFV